MLMRETMNVSETARCGNTERPLTHLLDGSERQAVSERTCTIEGCERRHKAHGWCEAHYARWKRLGDPGPVDVLPRRPRRRECVIEGCESKREARGWCELHYKRWKAHGDPNTILSTRRHFLPTGDQHPNWRGDAVGYVAAHQRVRAKHGAASTRVCGCGEPAAEWAYDHGDPNEQRDDRGCRYSTNPGHYHPMCIPCHRQLDRGVGGGR